MVEKIESIAELKKAIEKRKDYLIRKKFEFGDSPAINELEGCSDFIKQFEASVKERLAELESRPIKSYYGDVFELRRVLGEVV